MSIGQIANSSGSVLAAAGWLPGSAPRLGQAIHPRVLTHLCHCKNLGGQGVVGGRKQIQGERS